MIRHKRAYIALSITVIVAVVVGYVLVVRKPSHRNDTTSKAPTKSSPSKEQAKRTTTRLIATGDTIGHDALNNAAKQADGTYTYAAFMDQMKPILSSSQINFCNQSTLVGGEQFPITGYPSFNAPTALAKDMAGVGCNLINTASNHSSDKTQEVIDANVALWDTIPGTLAVVGQNRSLSEKNKVHTFDVDGLTYAFLAYTTYSNSPPATNYGVNMYSRDFATAQITEAKQRGAKFIIVSMRWGTEYSQGVNAQQLAESQYLADQGVKLILGHGPHVLEPVKKLQGAGGNETLVWYGLGNFLHAQLESETLFNGLAVMEIDPKTATISSVGFLPTYMHYDWTADQAARQDLLARKNFELVTLETAEPLFSHSQLKTTIDAQKTRLQKTLNTYTTVPFVTAKDLGL